ncbi:hypothetical protein BC829DRAFT_15403 [Chytridium lagenaria]|nr:hypothetical protein BC829DRAFT_15403 [Chytridium lagenaria]
MIDAQGRRLISDIKHLFDQKQSDAATEIRQMNEQLEHKVARIHELETQYRNSIQSLKVLEMEATQATQRLAAGMKAVFAISEALMVENFQMVQTTRERSSLHKLKPMNDALVTGVVSHVEKAFDGLNVDRDGYGRDLRNRLRNGDDRNDRDGRGRIGGRDGRDNDRKRRKGIKVAALVAMAVIDIQAEVPLASVSAFLPDGTRTAPSRTFV